MGEVRRELGNPDLIETIAHLPDREIIRWEYTAKRDGSRSIPVTVTFAWGSDVTWFGCVVTGP
jgi:hypothetical protein